jgi:hypothetical protein
MGEHVIQVAFDNWPSSARIPRELNAAGLAVIALCGPKSPLRLTRYAAQVTIIAPEGLGAELEQLVLETAPAAIIASDELAVRQLHALAARGSISERLQLLLRRSFGDPRFYPTLTSKWAVAEIARRLNITVPLQAQVGTVNDAMAFAREAGFPVILKRENSYGGMGCHVCRSEPELRWGFGKLRRSSWIHRAPSAILRGRSAAGLHDLSQQPLIIQKYQEGQLAFVAAVVHDGVMVSGLAAVADEVHPAPTGASTVIRAIDGPELLEISRTLTAETRCSGFVGLDFIIDRASARPYFLEINPRLTPLCHLARRFGTDLCAAFASSFAGLPVTRHQGRKVEMAALFRWPRSSRPNGCATRAARISGMPITTSRSTTRRLSKRPIAACRRCGA